MKREGVQSEFGKRKKGASKALKRATFKDEPSGGRCTIKLKSYKLKMFSKTLEFI